MLHICFSFCFPLLLRGVSLLHEGFIWLQRMGATLVAACRRLTVGAPPAERGSGTAALVAVAPGLVCLSACGLFADEGLNPLPHTERQLLRH